MKVKFHRGYATFFPTNPHDHPQLEHEPKQIMTMSIGQALKFANISIMPSHDGLMVTMVSSIEQGEFETMHYPWKKNVHKQIIRAHARRILNYYYWITIKNQQL